MIGTLREDRAEAGRAAAAEHARGGKGKKAVVAQTIDTGRKWCSCDKPWNDGDGDCVHCGKSIRGISR